MDEEFELPVFFRGEELCFKTRLLQYGYARRFEVEVNSQKVLFEPDEERSYRALVEPFQVDQMKSRDIEVLQAIAALLEQL